MFKLHVICDVLSCCVWSYEMGKYQCIL